MKGPQITLNGKTYTAPQPKAFLWREIMKVKNAWDGMTDEERYDTMLTLITKTFRHPDVTVASLDDEDNGLPIEELMPVFWEIMRWVMITVDGLNKKIPNIETPPGN